MAAAAAAAATSTVFELLSPLKTEDVSTDSHQEENVTKNTHSYLPLNLKLSPKDSYSDDKLVTSLTCSTEDTIKNRLQEFFVTSESNAIALEEKAKSLRQLYTNLTTEEKTMFLRFISTQFGVDHNTVEHIAGQISSAASRKTEGYLIRLEDRLRSALVPRYQQLLILFSRMEHGVKFLLQLRVDVINVLAAPGIDQDSQHFQSLNSILHNLLSIWMAVGSLRLERITWESSCDLLQKICAFEAIQSIHNWTDLKRRVGPYRRCFAFMHITLPREPVVVIHVALSCQISNNIHVILGNRPLTFRERGEVESDIPINDNNIENGNLVTTAIFYSITSTQKGLLGIEFGNQLIRQVISEIQTEFPRMHQFSSLSPVPGFRDWLLEMINIHIHLRENGEDVEDPLLSDLEIIEFSSTFGSSENNVFNVLRDLLMQDAWPERWSWFSALKNLLMRQCARYLYTVKKRGRVLNAVANFHLCNGAVLWRLNWMADTTSRGLSGSCGIMVNYRYYPDEMELNSKNYIERHLIPASEQFLDLIHHLPVKEKDDNIR